MYKKERKRKGQESYVYLDRVNGVHDGVFGDTGKGTGEQAGGERGVLGQGLVIVVNLGLSHSCVCVCMCVGGEGEWGSETKMQGCAVCVVVLVIGIGAVVVCWRKVELVVRRG